MTSNIDWALARKVAGRFSANEPFRSKALREELEADFETYTPQAQELVEACTGLVSTAGQATGAVITRADWVDANLVSFERLLRPITKQLSGHKIGSQVAGAELGAMLGWMSTRVLGQYDLLLAEDETDPDATNNNNDDNKNNTNDNKDGIVYYVAPNVLALERRYAFDPKQFRLWLALHEVTHRAQFTGVPWMREHFLSLVHEVMDGLEADPDRFVEGFRRMKQARERGESPLDMGGLMALFASSDQLAAMQRIGGLMSLLEGHGDVIMTRAGEGLVPSAERFHKVMHNRRSSVRGFARFAQRLIGLEAKFKQYAEGENFLAAVEAAGGTELFNRVWELPDNLPDLAEIRNPQGWISRVGMPVAA